MPNPDAVQIANILASVVRLEQFFKIFMTIWLVGSINIFDGQHRCSPLYSHLLKCCKHYKTKCVTPHISCAVHLFIYNQIHKGIRTYTCIHMNINLIVCFYEATS